MINRYNLDLLYTPTIAYIQPSLLYSIQPLLLYIILPHFSKANAQNTSYSLIDAVVGVKLKAKKFKVKKLNIKRLSIKRLKD